MKQILLASIFSLAALLAFSQAPTDSNHETSPFWKAFSLEASYGLSTFKNKPSKTTHPELRAIIDNSITDQRGMDFRLGINYHFNSHFSIQSGIDYSIAEETYSYTYNEAFCIIVVIGYVYDSTTMDSSEVVLAVYGDTAIYTTKIEQNKYELLTIPFQFAYGTDLGKHGELELALGGSVSIHGKNSGSVIVDPYTNVISAERAYRTSGLLSLGGSIKYLHHFGEHHSAYIEPWLQVGVSSQSSPNLHYDSFRHRAGIRFGYRFYL